MATTGTVAVTTFTNRELIEAAFRRCRLPAQVITPEKVDDTLGELHRMLQSMPARVLPLWTVEKVLSPLNQGASSHLLPEGTIDIKAARLRTHTRYTGTATSTMGGTAANVIDGDLSTACVQTDALGSIALDLGEEKTFNTLALATSLDVTLTVVFESSDDAVTWASILEPESLDFGQETFPWWELDPQVTARYVRVRSTSGILKVAEFFVGGEVQEQPFQRVNHDQFISAPNPSLQGQPSRYWVDRQADGPIMVVWPTPDATWAFHCVTLWNQRLLMDVGTLRDTVEAPTRWYDALVAMLAYRIALNTPEVDLGLVALLKPEAVDALNLIAADERDASPARIRVNISRYTR
jgi:hypothetical protein